MHSSSKTTAGARRAVQLSIEAEAARSAPITAIALRTTGADPSRGEPLEMTAITYEDSTVRTMRTWKSDAIAGAEDSFEEALAAAVAQSARGWRLTFGAWIPARQPGSWGGGISGGWQVDVAALASLAWPTAIAASFPALLQRIGYQGTPVGPDECQALVALFKAATATLEQLPLEALSAMNRLLEPCYNEWERTLLLSIEEHARRRRTRARDPAPGDETGARSYASLLKRLEFAEPRARPSNDTPATERVGEDEIASLLGPNGPFSRLTPAYEHREGQALMGQKVANALSHGRHLLVEAGTGTGKSLAYLAPAALWATRNERPVIVSTNTKNLQSQLFEKDVPLVRQALDVPLRAAILKGRGNYACPRRVVQMLNHAETELETADRLMLLPALVWLLETDSGDLSELSIWSRPGGAALAARLGSSSDDCPGRACAFHRSCFFRKARAAAHAADIAIVNHALVFADRHAKTGALPPYKQLVFDEAHNLEEAATRHFSIEVVDLRFALPLRRLWRPRRRSGEGTGLCATLARSVRASASSLGAESANRIEGAIVELQAAVQTVEPAMKNFFFALESLLPAGTGADTARADRDRRAPEKWNSVFEAMTAFKQAVVAVATEAERLARILDDSTRDGEPAAFADAMREANAAVGSLREALADMEFFVEGDHADYVYWVERATAARHGARAWAAPLDVGPILEREVFASLSSAILCSATMTVRGSMDHLKKRIGLASLDADRLIELNAGSPFDYPRQCTLLVPGFLDDPGVGEANYAVALGELLAEVFRVSKGRGMALFTSYGMLKRTTEVLERGLEGTGIAILVQGVSGSREQILARFKSDISSILMGTHSFWEGVDAVGDTLSCLVVARLPFAVHTEPLVQARCERIEQQGRSAFSDYTLPCAVIRLRQGFGRLIRHRTDRGVVIVADRRMVSKRYGNWFQSSLPAPTETVNDRGEFLKRIAERLA